MMLITYLIGALIATGCICNGIVSIKHKKWLVALTSLFALPWVLWFAVSITVGGSTFHDAATNYSGFQEGHYYLLEHNRYTEVSYALFQRMRLFEVAAWISFSVAALSAIVNISLTRKTKG